MHPGREIEIEIEITAIDTSALEYDVPKYAVKFGGQEYNAIGYDTLDNGTLEYGALVDDMKANGSYTVDDAPKYAVKFGAPEYGAIGYGALGYNTIDFGALRFGAKYGVKFDAF